MPSRNYSEAPDSVRPRWLIVAAVIWVAGFLFAFFRQTLPNNPQYTRGSIWLDLGDQLLGGAVDGGAQSPPLWTIEGLNDRLPLIACGLMLFVSAWLMGTALILTLKRLPSCWPDDFFTRLEEVALQAGVGLALFSTWVLLTGLSGFMSITAIFAPAIPAAVWIAVLRFSGRRDPGFAESAGPAIDRIAAAESGWSRKQKFILYFVLFPFAVYLLIGSLTPSSDFDVREYHLQGPKEWFQAGRICFLRHNVYTSFPFLTEMISLAGMVVTGDPWRGSLTGQFVLASYALLTALTVFSIARRLGGRTVGLIGALLHLTTPWTLRISIIALVEGGLSYYLAATVLLLICLLHSGRQRHELPGVWCLVGILSGGAMACKYTGLFSVMLPAGFVLILSQIPFLRGTATESGGGVRDHRKILVNLAAFALGGLLIMGPWFYRNWIDTGNPVYPLADSLFQSPEWNQEIAVRWKPAHAPSEHNLSRIPQHLLDVAIRNDWSSGILFALIIPAAFLLRRNSSLTTLAAVILWQFATWWALTHRIDRFWVPAIPLVAALSAVSWNFDNSRLWRSCLVFFMTIATLFNLHFCRLPLIGFHSRLMPLADAERQVIRGDFQFLNEQLPKNARVLMVGEAQVFDARFDLLYNTVFDDSIFEQLVAAVPGKEPEPGFPQISEISVVKQNLRSERITHVLVNWNEILRYRLPGSYGYTPWVQPQRFSELLQLGILKREVPLSWRSWNDMSEQERQTVESWEGAELLRTNPKVFNTILLYEVALD